jgi:hypothetical protein
MEGNGGRTSYNVSIQMTNGQQMLLNLIRLRYTDSPLFLDVASVTTQSTFRSEITPVIPIPGFTETNPFKLGTDLMWQDQPTITYAPLQGDAFAERLLKPIDLRTIQLLCYSGWDIDRLFHMTIQSVGGVVNDQKVFAQTQESKDFSEVTHLLRLFQQKGQLQIGLKMKSTTQGDNDEEGLQFGFPSNTEEGKHLASLLECSREQHNQFIKEFKLGFNEEGRIGIMSRSILSCMYQLSRGVQVPVEHIESGFVKESPCDPDSNLDEKKPTFPLMLIRWSQCEPKDAFLSVKYHNCWFYIDDCDLSSKRTFALLLQLYNLNTVSVKNRGPILTLPLR